MRNLLIILVGFLFIPAISHGQTPPITTQCEGAEQLCASTVMDTTFYRDYSTGTEEWIGYSFFHYFQAGSGATSAGYLDMSSAGRFKYVLYGPFTSASSICDELNAMADPVIEFADYDFGHVTTESLDEGSFYLLVITYRDPNITFEADINSMVCEDETAEIACEDCIESFQPSNGKFILSAWVKEDISGGSSVTTYANTKITVTGSSAVDFFPSGQIIDGWQRIEGVFTASSTGAISVELVCSDGEAYFDDIRIFPYDGSMMSYVYDPITRRLMAELDERNYAKLYEYDEEGKLVRVKKETEKGIMTIQENRDNNSKE